MGKMKEFGMQVARMVFEDRKSVDDIVKILSNRVWVDGEGHLASLNVDPDWLKEQVEGVKSEPELWGYPKDVLVPKPPKPRYRPTPRKGDQPPRRGG